MKYYITYTYDDFDNTDKDPIIQFGGILSPLHERRLKKERDQLLSVGYSVEINKQDSTIIIHKGDSRWIFIIPENYPFRSPILIEDGLEWTMKSDIWRPGVNFVYIITILENNHKNFVKYGAPLGTLDALELAKEILEKDAGISKLSQKKIVATLASSRVLGSIDIKKHLKYVNIKIVEKILSEKLGFQINIYFNEHAEFTSVIFYQPNFLSLFWNELIKFSSINSRFPAINKGPIFLIKMVSNIVESHIEPQNSIMRILFGDPFGLSVAKVDFHTLDVDVQKAFKSYLSK